MRDLLKEIVANRGFIEFSLDHLSIPEDVIKKGRPHGHRYGKTPEKEEDHLADNLKKRCIKKKFRGIHERFLARLGRSCRTRFHLSNDRIRIFSIQTNFWWISLNKSGTRQNDWENVLTSTKRRLHQTVCTEKLEDENSGPRPTGSTRNGNRHRALPPLGGNGRNPGGLPKNSRKSMK